MLLPPDTDVLVVANPGTGKTWEIADTVIGLLKNGVPGQRIACLTFTNRAAREMFDRIMQMAAGDPVLLQSIYSMDIGTMHSLAFRMDEESTPDDLVSNSLLRFLIFRKLRELKTFNYADDYVKSDIVPRFENMIRYIKSFGIYPQDINSEKVLEIIRDKLVDQEDDQIGVDGYERLLHDFTEIYAFYEDYKKGHGMVDYNDILHSYLIQIDAPVKDYVLVDEFQDLSREQVSLAERIATRRFFVGDRKQSIFGFQGGSLSQFNEFISRQGYSKVTKKINRRSTNNILNYSSRLLESRISDGSISSELQGFHNPEKGDGEKVTVITADEPESAAVNALTDMLNRGITGDYAIIVRTNTQLARIHKLLSSTGLQFSSTLTKGRPSDQLNEVMSFLRGILLPGRDYLKRALFTPFSGLTFHEAVEISEKLHNSQDEAIIPSRISDLRGMNTGIEVVRTALDQVIIPISVSLGQEYFSAASSIYSASADYLNNVTEFQPEDYLDFLDMSVLDQEEDLKKSQINILTVHKAKGQEFHNVIYIPSHTNGRLKFLDLLSYAIVSGITGIDVESDLRDEPYRIDYVAMTRARERLSVVTDRRTWKEFYLDDKICQIEENHTQSDFSLVRKYDAAYSMFVNGRTEDAAKIIREDRDWIRRRISQYFSNLTELSPSLVKLAASPWDFLHENILGIREQRQSAATGIEFHRLAEQYTTGRVNASEIPDALFGMIGAIDQIIASMPGKYARKPWKTETRFSIPLREFLAMDHIPPDMIMKGTIDAIFSAQDGSSHLIVDYKTGRDIKSEYWQQIWSYCRLFSASTGTDPASIQGAIAYVNLRGPVNSGTPESELIIREFSDLNRQSRTVTEGILKVVQFREDPEMFIESLLSRKPQRDLDMRLAGLLD
ncbi:MAG: ATP-dependent helicase [Candidatus Thermoplasmatota archaeon]|nr:ATP-dependent helicase [Candidatus Thermoplasmatota archaeon]